MTPPALVAYRACPKIRPVLVRDEAGFRDWDHYVCANDGIRVDQNADARWRHSLTEIAELAAMERGEGTAIRW